MSNQRPGGPMEWYSADDKNSSTGSQPAGFDEERREEEERRRAEEEERRREEEERRRVEEEERRREEEERRREEEERRRVEEEERRREEEERRREEEERRQSERYESNDEAQPQTGADNGSGSENSPFAGDSSEGIKDSPAARYGRDGPVAHSRTEPAGQQVDVEYDQAESDDASASVRPATESHAVYGGGAARTITRRLSSLARAGSAAGKKLAKRVAPKASNGQHPSAPSPQTSGPTTVPGQSAPPGPEPSRQTAATTPEELERRLKLSLRETSVGRTSRIAVGSPKGGVGKSSIAYALAGSIAYYTNMRVVLIDADPNFGSTRLLVPRPVSNSVVELARDADELRGLSDLRSYIAQNEKMRLDVALGPEHPYELAEFEDLSEAYGRIDSVLGEYYDVLVYDLGLGFRDSAIRSILTFCNQLLFVSDSEVIPNAMLADAITYVANVGVDLSRTTLAINHRLPTTDESASTEALKTAHQSALRRVTEIPYDPSLSRLLNQRAFHIDELSGPTRLGMLTTVAACLEGIKDTADIHSEMGVPSAGVVPAGDPDDPPSRNGRGRK